ncbi:MAG: hypothetical protein M3245_06545 [Actinomycetota bacterium]|nr:hypothetical protein [Actinomycetota bacterium]
MKRALFLALVLLVLLVGLPIAAGMPAMMSCPQCHLTAGAAAMMCLAVLSLFVLLAPTASSRLWRSDRVLRQLLLVPGLERPPRP